MVRRKRSRYSDSPPLMLLLTAIALLFALAYASQPVFSAFHQSAEQAHVDSLLDRLRLAMTAHSERSLNEGELPPVCNPFELLQPPPNNYLGVLPETELSSLPFGSWCFVADYNWIAYRPVNPIYNGVQYGQSRLVLYVVSPAQAQPGRTGIRLVQPPRFSFAWQ